MLAHPSAGARLLTVPVARYTSEEFHQPRNSMSAPAYAQDVQNTEYEPTKTTTNAANAPTTPAIRTAAERERSAAQAISPARGSATRA
jgi:hypothetical protein